MSDKRKQDYAALPAEELEVRLREAFFVPDRIDETVFRELEDLRAALEEKRPPEEYDPEAAWERFLEDNARELEELWGPEEKETEAPREKKPKGRRFRFALRAGLVAAVLLVLLAGAALAADGLGYDLWAWVRGWSEASESSAAVGAEGSPIRQTLETMGVREPIYPSWLPQDFVLAEAHISEDPLLLYELYTRGDRYISITVSPVTAVEKAMYPREERLPEEYRAGDIAHYLFSNSGSVTGVWYTENYFVSISGNITARVMKRIIDSVYAG